MKLRTTEKGRPYEQSFCVEYNKNKQVICSLLGSKLEAWANATTTDFLLRSRTGAVGGFVLGLVNATKSLFCCVVQGPIKIGCCVALPQRRCSMSQLKPQQNYGCCCVHSSELHSRFRFVTFILIFIILDSDGMSRIFSHKTWFIST